MPSAWDARFCEGLTPPLRSPKQVGRLGFYSPEEGAPPLRPRVTFPSRGKSPKARQGLRPLESPRCEVAALFALAYASRRATSCHNKRPICHFERVGKSVLFFSSSYTGGHTLSCQSVVRQVDLVSADGPEWHPFLGGAATPLGG